MLIFQKVVSTVLLLAIPATAAAQLGTAPTRAAKASTPDEDRAIQAGATLHDDGKFDEAIAKYEEILKTSPDNMTALYELAYSLHEKKDLAKSMEVATRGTAYKSDLLPMFYDLIASSLDSQGKADDAVAVYKQGIALAPDATTLYFNLAITYLESLRNPAEARRWLKQAASIDPEQPTIQLMLGQAFQTDGYSVPALFAFAKYLVLEPNGGRAISAYGFWRALLRGGLDAAPAAPITRDSAMPAAAPRAARTDEGDFRDIEAAIARSQQTVIADMDSGAGEMTAFLAHMTRFFTVLEQRPVSRDQDTFIGKNYLPYFRELKQRNFIEPYLYWSMQRGPVPGVREWLTGNQARVREFVEWTRNYNWPK